jgi:CBS domain-containing protein
MRRSILTEKLARRGHHIVREYSIDPFELARVSDVMDRDVPSVPSTMPLAEYSDRITDGDASLSKRQATVLLDEHGRLAGIITRGDVLRALRQKDADHLTVASAGSSYDLVVTYPDEPLHTALSKMLTRGIGRLPVVEPNEPSRVVGYLGRAAILSARMHFHNEEHVRQRGSGNS